jgi:hypothetical protein
MVEMFRGHKFIRLINNSWVLDITEFVGYSVEVGKNEEVIGYQEAFKVRKEDGEVEFDKFIDIPVIVLKEAANQIKLYSEEFEGKRD